MMKVKLLGSAAAEGVPALWCECDACAYARTHKGKDIRCRTSYLIDDDTLVDFGLDTYAQTLRFDIDLTKIKRVILTHSHKDHLNVTDLLMWRHPGGFSDVRHDIEIYANATCFGRMKDELPNSPETYCCKANRITAGVPVESENMRILPIEASHAGPEEEALNYVLGRGDKKVLIANDTGFWAEPSWELIRGVELDAAIIECTGACARADMGSGHLGWRTAIEFRDRLRSLGAINDRTQVFVNHFSHNGAPIHENMEKIFTPQDIKVGYDGLEIDI